MQFHPLRRARTQRLGLAPRNMIVGDIGQLGKDGKGADQKQDFAVAAALEQVERAFPASFARAIFAHRLAADAFHQLKGFLAMLLADHLAQKTAQKPDRSPVLAR
jgi:hypothetical protein